MNNNKRGISAVVATVLIILITVAAVTIIWAAIIPMINNQLESGTLCLDAVSQVSIVDQGGYTCFNKSTGGENSTISIQVAHGAKSFDLAGVQVLVSQGGSTESFDIPGDIISTGTVTLPGVNEQKVFVFNYSDSDGAKIDGTPDSLQLAPVVKIGASQEICSVSSDIILRACN